MSQIIYSTTFDIQIVSVYAQVGSDMGGLMYDRTGMLRTVNVNWNDDGWNVNANEVSNPNSWNDDNQVFSRNYCFSPLLVGGVFFSKFFSMPFFQPPNILPISCKCSESAEYFSFVTHLFSHAICKKNLTPSSLDIAITKRVALVSGGRYMEIKMFSKRPRK